MSKIDSVAEDKELNKTILNIETICYDEKCQAKYLIIKSGSPTQYHYFKTDQQLFGI
jgi:hypothetical protein